MQVNGILKHFTGSQDKVNFSIGVSQVEKEPLPEGVVIADSQPNSLAATVQVVNCDVKYLVMRCMTTSVQCINTPLMPGTSSRGLVAKYFVAL